MLFKIPRNIERRKATLDMDLYDQVVGLDCEAVHIWTRQEKAVEPIVILFREITGVRLYQRLLLGICTIYGQNGGTEIRYNTVSSAIMWKFTELIRKECPIENVAPTGIQGDLNLRENDVDIWLYNQMRDLRERGTPFELDAYQPCWSACRTGRRFPWTKPEEFAGTLYLHNDRELLLLRSGKPEKKGEQKYSAEFTAIPWTSLRDVTLEPSGEYADGLMADLHLSATVLRTEIPSANTGAVRFLQELAEYCTSRN